MTEKLRLSEMLRLNIGLTIKELVELLNGDYELDSSDEELLIELWEEAANTPPREDEQKYDEPDYFWLEPEEEPDFWLVEDID